MGIRTTIVALCLVLLAVPRSLESLQGPPPGETEYLRAARQAARHLGQVQRREAAGVSWPVSDLSPARQTGMDSGAAGIGWFHLELYKATGDPDYLVTAEQAAAFINARYRASQWNGTDWLSGAAGGGSFLLAMYDETRQRAFLDGAIFAADWLLASALSAPGGGRYWKVDPALSRIYTGVYHGAAGIGLFMLDMHQRTGEARYLGAARDAAAWLSGYAVRLGSGGIGWKRLTTDTVGYTHFCGGATGIMLFFQRLFEATGERQYREILRMTAQGLVHTARKTPDTVTWAYHTDDRGNAPVVFCHGASSAALALHRAHSTIGDSRLLVTARGAAAWTLQMGRALNDAATYWPHIDQWDQFESGYRTGTASIGSAMLSLHRADPNSAYLDAAMRAGNYLLAIADRPGEGRLRWINYTNPARPDWPHEYLNGWYSGSAGIGMFLIELDATLRNRPLPSATSGR